MKLRQLWHRRTTLQRIIQLVGLIGLILALVSFFSKDYFTHIGLVGLLLLAIAFAEESALLTMKRRQRAKKGRLA